MNLIKAFVFKQKINEELSKSESNEANELDRKVDSEIFMQREVEMGRDEYNRQ